ncbi:prolyl oligopeptidase family serine peptidase [Aerococcaceae bacterium DSM 111020]|nr:prolyl oligopeptidase family serine peptidase [Aerococcaceae bacterium DSM 111020]
MNKIHITNEMIGHIPILSVSLERLKDDNLPLIIFYHGWRINKKLVLTQGRKLAQKGFRVILPDAQSHGERYQESTKIPSLTFFNSIYHNLFEFGYLLHHVSAIYGTPHFIGLGGVSMGGMTTAALLTHHPEIDAAAILMGSANLTAYRDRIYQHATENHSWMPEDYQELLSWIPLYDLAKHPESLKDRPLFIWHGRQDEKVPFEHMESFVRENKQLNLTVHFQDRGHLVETDTMDLVTQFFTEQL